MRAVVFDVETTGVDWERDRVIEVGIILTDWTTIFAASETLVRPPHLFDRPWWDKSKIRPKDCESAPAFATVAPFVLLLLALADEHVAYNAPFDLKFLQNELARCDLWLPRRPVFDPMKSVGKISLKDACVRNKIFLGDDYPWHTAMGDASATFRLWQKLRLRNEDFDDSSPPGRFVLG